MQHRLVTTTVARSVVLRATPLWFLIAASWAVLVALSVSGNGDVIRHDRLLQGGPPLWVAMLVFIAGWQVMLWAMMVAPSIGAISDARSRRNQAAFVLAYLAVWTGFGVAAFVFDMGVHATVNHSPWLTLHPWVIAGVLLIIGGLYQLSNRKLVFLTTCRTLTRAGDRHMSEARESFASGVQYGVQCLGANWALMLLAFALAAGSLAVMAIFTAVMVLEASATQATWVVKATGYAIVAVAVFVLLGPLTGPLWIG